MNGFSYIVVRDFGFAPNPFGKYCTLATCKPLIRKHAQVGDIVIGLSPKRFDNTLVYLMHVNEKISFTQYWNDPRFQYKKPIMNGSLKQLYGDNIYFLDDRTKEWHQADSHHSFENGEMNYNNLKRDTSSDSVLISNDFYYFGNSPINIPDRLKSKMVVGIGYRPINDNDSECILNWLHSDYMSGLYDIPKLFKNFQRYNGK